MVGRIRSTSNPTPAQSRKAAQRRLAKEIREGTFQPSNIGKKAREAPSVRANLVRQIQEHKERQFGNKPKYNAKRSNDAISIDPNTGKARSIKELKNILDYLEEQDEEDNEYFGPDLPIDRSSLYYH